MSSAVMTVSPAAVERLRGLLSNAAPGDGLRVSVEKGGCAGMSYKMEIGEPRMGDEVIDTEGGQGDRRRGCGPLSARNENGCENHSIRLDLRLRKS